MTLITGISICYIIVYYIHIIQKSDVEGGGEKESDDTETVESEEIPSRNQLKMTSEKQVAQRRVEDKPKKKRTIKSKTSTSCSPDSVQHHQPPPTPKVKNMVPPPRSHRQKSRDTDKVSAFLTEMPVMW